MLYLDCAASAPIFPNLLSEEERLLCANPSANHRQGREISALLESCRDKIGKLFSLNGTFGKEKIGQVVFCSGATEANNLAIYNQILPKLLQRSAKIHACCSNLDHPSCTQTLRQLKPFGLDLHNVPLSPAGALLLERSLHKYRAVDFLFATVTAVESESGCRQDLAQLAEVICAAQTQRHAAGLAPFYIHADLSQYLSCEEDLFRLELLGLYLETAFDSIALSGQKVGAGRGAGILLQRSTSASFPVWSFSQGGGQEGGLRSGTENIAAILSMVRAIEKQVQESKGKLQRSFKFLQQLAEQPSIVLQPDYRSAEILGDNFSPYIFSLAVPPLPAEVLQRLLSDRGYMVGVGSACSGKGNAKKLLALGYDAELVSSVLRISFGTGASYVEDFREFFDCLVELQGRYA